MIKRPEIDGLRSIAVLPVILFHCGIDIFSGGYVGVDIFFVISGYLITSLIMEQKYNNNFSILNFYERRARRILPALFFVLIISIPIFFYIMNPFQLHDYSQSLIATILFLSNYLFYVESSYFALDSELKPFLHTWSLSIEEQFYIFFPILMLVIWSLNKKAILLLLIILGISMASWFSYDNPSASFFLFHTRSWEILTGSLLAIYRFDNKIDITKKKEGFFSLLGIFLILFSIFYLNENTPYPGFYTLIPIIGTLLLIQFATEGTLVHFFLTRKIFIFFGTISYSAYLWHQPILSLLKIKTGLDLNFLSIFLTLITTLILSIASYKFIEQPFRKKNYISTRKFICIIIIIFIPLFAFGLTGHYSKGFYEFKLNQISHSYFFEKSIELEKRHNFLKKVNKKQFEKNSSKKRILVIGDSVAQDISAAISIGNYSKDYDVVHMQLDDTCHKIFFKEKISFWTLKGQKCNNTIPLLKSFLEENKLDLIIIHAQYQPHNYINGIEFASKLAEKTKVIFIRTLTFNDISSLVLRPDFENINIERYIFNNLRPKYLNMEKSAGDVFSKYKNLVSVKKINYFCNVKDRECNIFSPSKKPYFIDKNHLSVEGIKYLSSKLSLDNFFQ